MGSFNISCGTSGQVIAPGEKCWAIPVIQESTFSPVVMEYLNEEISLYGIANSICNPGCFWRPMTGFVSGTYADYGYIQPEDTPTNRRAMAEFFNTLYRSAPTVFLGENTVHDLAFNIKGFMVEKAPVLAKSLAGLPSYSRIPSDALVFSELDAVWQYVWDVARESRLFCADRSRHVRPVQFCAMHHVTVNHLTGLANKQSNWDGQAYELGAYLRSVLEKMDVNIRLLKAYESLPEATVMASQKFFILERIRESLKLGMTDSVHDLLFPFMTDHLDFLERHLVKGMSFDELVEALRPTLTGIYVLAGMDALNLKFSPIVYAGQDYDNSQGKALAKFISTVSKEISKERDKRFD